MSSYTIAGSADKEETAIVNLKKKKINKLKMRKNNFNKKINKKQV
jgi:hypothetical protein